MAGLIAGLQSMACLVASMAGLIDRSKKYGWSRSWQDKAGVPDFLQFEYS